MHNNIIYYHNIIVPDPPTNLSVNQVMPSGLFLLTWKAPPVVGMIRSYHIEVTDTRDMLSVFNGTTGTNDPHFLMEQDLDKGRKYKFRVAAFTTEKGNFSTAAFNNVIFTPQGE